MFKSLNAGIAATLLVASASVTAGPYGIGAEATPEMIAGWDIDIRPDGGTSRWGGFSRRR